MTDLLQQGAAWLDRQRRGSLSRTIVYQRGADSVELPATVGQSRFDLQDEYGVALRIESRDYLITAADLVLGGSTTLPQHGDLIRETQGTTTFTYQVMAPGSGQQAWRYCDSYRTTLRTGDADGLYIAHDRYRLTDDGPFATLTALGFDGNVRWRIDQSDIPLHMDGGEPYGMTGLGAWTYPGAGACGLATGNGKVFVRHGRAHEYWESGPPYYGACISDWINYKYPGIDLVALGAADGSLFWKAGHLSTDMNPYVGGSGGNPLYIGGRLFASPPTVISGQAVGYLDPRADQLPGSGKPCNCQEYDMMLNAELDPGTGRTIQSWSSDYAGGPMGAAAGGSLLYKLGYFGGSYVTRITTDTWQCANRPNSFDTRSGNLWVCVREAATFAASATDHVYAVHNDGGVTLARWDESRATGTNYYATGPNGDGAAVSGSGDEVWTVPESAYGVTSPLYADSEHNVYYTINAAKTLKSRDEIATLRWQTQYPICDYGGGWTALWVPS